MLCWNDTESLRKIYLGKEQTEDVVIDLSANSPEKKKKKGPSGAFRAENCYSTTAKFAITPTAHIYKNPYTYAEAAMTLKSEDKPKEIISAVKLILTNGQYLDKTSGSLP